MIRRKMEADRIKEHLQRLGGSPWLGPARRWWPKFLFHFSDLRNVVSILESGRLLPRSQCEMAVDSASPQVIEQTDERWKQYVRFYFRPRTPTQFHNEGIRPVAQLGALQAHCPMPVFLLFDAIDVLTREDTEFSRGSLATADSEVGSSADFFASIPFEQVYHASPLSEDEKRKIVFHRHAEAIVPHEVDLSALKWIVCRSEAEFQTLHWSVSEQCWKKWAPMTTFGSRGNLFFRRGTFIESVGLEQNRVVFHFNESTTTPGPFAACLTVLDPSTEQQYRWQQADFLAKAELTVNIPQIVRPTPFDVSFTLDNYLAYRGRYSLPTDFW